MRRAKSQCSLPLIRRRQKRIRIVEFADLELTDYNAPLLGPAAPREPKAAAILWRDLRLALRRLPGGADLIRLRKCRSILEARPNPLATLDGAGPCSLNGNLVTTGDDFNQYKRSLKRDVRRVLDRSWRAFTAYPDAAFRIAGEKDEALRLLATLDAQQSARMQQLGVNFILNDEAHAAFYRNLVRDGVGGGYAVVSALTVGEEVVADLARHALWLTLCDGAVQQCRREMVELFARPAGDRTHHGGAARRRRARV